MTLDEEEWGCFGMGEWMGMSGEKFSCEVFATSNNWPQAGTGACLVNPRVLINPDPSSPPRLMSRDGRRVPEP